MSGEIIDVSDGLNYDKTYSASTPIMKVYKGELYCAWSERGRVKMKKYDGNSWINISSSLNYDSSKYAYNPIMQVYKDELYCVWQEGNGSNNIYQIKIKRYDGNSWINVSDSLNYNSSKRAENPAMEVYKNELYCIWSETSGSNYQIRIKKYDGNSWKNVSSNLNYDGNKSAHNPIMQVYKDELYCAWHEDKGSYSQIKIKKYNGINWRYVSSNLNYDSSKHAQVPVIKMYNSELYCTWMEVNNSNRYQIKIKKYNEDSWYDVSSSLNYDKSKTAYNPKIKVYKDELYCIWQENNANDSIWKIKMKKYDGNSWLDVSSSLNYNENKTAYNPVAQVYKDELYCIWSENNENNIYQIKVKKYSIPIEKIQKYLIKYNDKYFRINDDREIVEVENNDFKANGFNHINLMTRELLESKFDSLKNMQILMWTNDIEKNEATMTCDLRNPYRPIDILKKNNDGICNILFKEL